MLGTAKEHLGDAAPTEGQRVRINPRNNLPEALLRGKAQTAHDPRVDLTWNNKEKKWVEKKRNDPNGSTGMASLMTIVPKKKPGKEKKEAWCGKKPQRRTGQGSRNEVKQGATAKRYAEDFRAKWSDKGEKGHRRKKEKKQTLVVIQIQPVTGIQSETWAGECEEKTTRNATFDQGREDTRKMERTRL